jgi:hypothetical protein
MHPVVTSHKAVVCEIEELGDSMVDLYFLQVILMHLGSVLASVVFIS